MLQIKNITKKYVTGELTQLALNGVSMSFRDSEFVAVLGPSGSGKTTLLNIVGGLDRYDGGNLIINGISTKKYSDRDWDSYRNHTIGFVFQSYNLIPHQSVLSNVELALTISGIGRAERRRRAKEALIKVGLGDQLHKKPNQMSGGQMQRVAIARALVNNPDILLADEPTGALDTETSIQVMELLKEVAKDRLVVMVTHNPELAEKYATRTVKLRDGKITDDSNPYDPDTEKLPEPKHKNMGKSSMSFMTALSLSFKNLMTKKGRTVLMSFAGSIGIIGIALILALSTGVNAYITDIQRDTMTSYPITIQSQTIDLSSLMSMGGMQGRGETETGDRTGIYSDSTAMKISNTLTSNILENNLTAFKKYLDNPESKIHEYLGENGIVYTYDVSFDVFSHDKNGTLVSTGADNPGESSGGGFSGMSGGMASMLGGSSSSGAENFAEMMPGKNGAAVSAVITDSYDLLYGSWADDYDEVMLVLRGNNSLSVSVLYKLGLITEDEYNEIKKEIEADGEAEELSFNYEDVCSHTFYLVPSCDYYVSNGDGTFSYVGDDALYTDSIIENSLKLKIAGVIRPVKDAANANLSSAVAYTSKLTDYIIEHTNESPVVIAQENTPDVNIISGLSFEAADDKSKADDTKAYLSKLTVSEKAAVYKMLASYIGGGQAPLTDEAMQASALDMWLAGAPDEKLLISLYDKYVSGASYDDNMKSFGKVSYDAPSSISIYTDSFENKDRISECIEEYNKGAGENEQITYTDYVALLTKSITQIVNVISYVLIAFVAVSLVVSCIMIGIITHISVLERTKEIGILRAIGASKHNISQVFNAETFIIGLCSGLIGVGLSLLLLVPINAIIHALANMTNINAFLTPAYMLILILIALLITVLGGLIPARKAAKKDPVIALRTE